MSAGSEPVTLMIPGEPVPKARARVRTQGKKTWAYTPPRVQLAEKLVAAQYQLLAQCEPDADSEFAVTAVFRCARPRKDIDNMLKLVLDALNKVAWADDTQVTAVSAVKIKVPQDKACSEVMITRASHDSS